MRYIRVPRVLVALLCLMLSPVIVTAQEDWQIKQIQENLKAAGFDPGPIDGILGLQTKAALRQYQAIQGLPVTGALDEQTLNLLGVQAKTARGNFQSERVVKGRFIWDDGSPVTRCQVKLVDRLKFYDAPYSGPFPGSMPKTVKRFKIAEDAYVRETEVDSQGRFQFIDTPPGTYYLFWKAPDSSEGNEWVYRHRLPFGVAGYVPGMMPEAERYEIKKEATTNIGDIKLSRKEKR